MMSRTLPSSRAVHVLRQHGVDFGSHIYRYTPSEKIAKQAATALDVDERLVFKTLVFLRKTSPLLVLIDASHRVSLHKLSTAVGDRSRVSECSERDAERYTGYKVGGISPFGTRRSMPIYLDSSASNLERIYVNGGSHGFMLSIRVSDFIKVLKPVIADLRSE